MYFDIAWSSLVSRLWTIKSFKRERVAASFGFPEHSPSWPQIGDGKTKREIPAVGTLVRADVLGREAPRDAARLRERDRLESEHDGTLSLERTRRRWSV